MSATNLFNAANNALNVQPTLRKVIVMKQIPRYDPAHVDPMGLKPTLSLLFNNTLTNLWMDSPNKDKIFVGTHDIECTGAIKESRYRQTKSGKFDGIHLYGSSGRKAFTLSVLRILKAANVTSSEHDFHQSCAQFKYQNMKARQSGQQSAKPRGWKARNNHHQQVTGISTSSRFSRLPAMDQGNW